MNSKIRTKDSIVEFIDDEAFHAFKKNKSAVEKGTLALYMYATLSLLSYFIFFLVTNMPFDWVDVTINMLLVIIYYGLAFFSSYEPFNAFISIICAVIVVTIAHLILSTQPSIKGIFIRIILIAYVATKLEAAKQVQAYKKTTATRR